MKVKTVAAFVVSVALAVGLSACASSSGTDGGAQSAPPASQKLTVTVWTFFKDRELAAMQSVVDDYHKLHPNVTVKLVGGLDDDKITQGIRGGTGPDIAESSGASNLGQFCSSTSFIDLAPYISRDHLNLAKILPKAALDYTSFNGTRCAVPSLADDYGLYYNPKLLAAAGISAPPKTMSELAADAVKLTKYNADGTIKVAGFVPTPGFYEENVQTLAPQFNAQWQDASKRSSLAKSAGWTEMLDWQRTLTAQLGADKLTKFTASAGQEFSSDNDFEAGKLAMMIDGEWRTAFIKNDVPSLQYATAPFPVSDAHPELYGTSYTSGNIVGIARGSKNPGAAWELVKYLSIDAKVQGKLADLIHGVPSTIPSLQTTALADDPHFKTFLDLFGGGKLQTSPGSSNGAAYVKTAEDFAYKYVTGGSGNLKSGLAQADKQIDSSSALG